MAKKSHKDLIFKMGFNSLRNAALEANLSQSTLTRHVAKNEVEAGEVIALARAKKINPITWLISFGYIKRSDIKELMPKDEK